LFSNLNVDFFVFCNKLVEKRNCFNTISNNKPKQSSIEANPSIKKFIEKHVISSMIEPTMLAKQYKVTQINSDNSIKKNKLLGAIRKLKNSNQIIELKKIK
jgi:hypothetical protein